MWKITVLGKHDYEKEEKNILTFNFKYCDWKFPRESIIINV